MIAGGCDSGIYRVRNAHAFPDVVNSSDPFLLQLIIIIDILMDKLSHTFQ